MGFNKRYLPEVEKLKEKRKQFNSDEDFLLSVVGKSDSLMGSEESFRYLDYIKKNIEGIKK
jgi:hypothetical protein